MSVDRDALTSAFERLKDLSFPGHPDDLDFAEWVLELSELDGHIAGLADTALASSSTQSINSRVVAEHASRLREISVIGDDELIYDECLAYIRALQRVEDALCGRVS